MRPVLFLTAGTRGDVLPILALAGGLQRRGIPVRVGAPPAFGAIAAQAGIPFSAFQGNPSALLQSPGGQSALTLDGNPWRSLLASLRFVQQARPHYLQMLQTAAPLCREASALVIGLPTLWAAHLAQAHRLPLWGAFLQPASPTRAFASPLLPVGGNFGVLNPLTYRLSALATWLPWRGVLNQWRRGAGLPALVDFDFHAALQKILYGISPGIFPPPADYPTRALFTGYWKFSLPFTPPASLQSFLRKGKPPLYVGFGSPGVRLPVETVQQTLQAAQKTASRLVFALPPGADLPGRVEGVYPLREAVPHGWLFPQMAGVVHHGGAGTTAAGLNAGVPALLCPLAMDQFFWAEQLLRLGVSPSPLPQRRLSAPALAERFDWLQQNTVARQKAAQLALVLAGEDGVERAAQEFTCLV